MAMDRELLIKLLAHERGHAIAQGKNTMAKRIAQSICYAKGAVPYDQVIRSIPVTVYNAILRGHSKALGRRI